MEEHAAEVPSMKDMAQDMARIRAQNPDRMARIDGMMSNLIIPSQLINDHVFSAHIGKLMSDPAAAKDVTEGAFMMVEQSRGAAGDGGHGNGETGNAGDEHTS